MVLPVESTQRILVDQISVAVGRILDILGIQPLHLFFQPGSIYVRIRLFIGGGLFKILRDFRHIFGVGVFRGPSHFGGQGQWMRMALGQFLCPKKFYDKQFVVEKNVTFY